MKSYILYFFLICFMSCHRTEKPVNLIFDTDMAPDYDDVGALALLHALADSGEVNILATISSNKCATAVPCIDVINTYFGRPDIPIGAVRGEAADRTTWHSGLRWTDELPMKYPHRILTTADSEDALKLYRRALAQQSDQSVTIVTVGFFSNLQNLLLSEPDEISPLFGKELIKKKVKQLVSMAGSFPKGREFNIYVDVKASQFVIREWPTPILFSGFEIGSQIFTGKKLMESGIRNNPIVDTYTIVYHKIIQMVEIVGIRQLLWLRFVEHLNTLMWKMERLSFMMMEVIHGKRIRMVNMTVLFSKCPKNNKLLKLKI